MGENGGKNKKKKHQKILWSIDMVLALFNFKAISFLGEFQVGKHPSTQSDGAPLL